MNKKEQNILDRQLDDIADKLLMDGWLSTNEITEVTYRRLYRRMLVKLRGKIDEKLKVLEEAK